MISLNTLTQAKLEAALDRAKGLEILPPTIMPEVWHVRSGSVIYMVIIDGQKAHCNCRGGQADLFCKHVAAVKEVIAEGKPICGECECYPSAPDSDMCQNCIEAELMERQEFVASFKRG